VVVRADAGPGALATRETRGAETVARQALGFSRIGLEVRMARVNGAIGAVTFRDGRPFSVSSLTVRGGRIVAMTFLADPERLARLDVSALED
jgi:RNA polymerase sigma-70 factor (ECF subfamily)